MSDKHRIDGSRGEKKELFSLMLFGEKKFRFLVFRERGGGVRREGGKPRPRGWSALRRIKELLNSLVAVAQWVEYIKIKSSHI